MKEGAEEAHTGELCQSNVFPLAFGSGFCIFTIFSNSLQDDFNHA